MATKKKTLRPGVVREYSHLQVTTIDDNGNSCGYDPAKPATIEEAREIIAKTGEGRPGMCKSDRDYWASRRYAIERVYERIERLEVSEPSEN